MTMADDTDFSDFVDLPQEICFGLNRDTDAESLARLLAILADRELLSILVPRLEDQEITDLADHIFRLLRRHFSHREYHRFF